MITDSADHLVFAVPDLDLGIKKIHDLLGVEATYGGKHQHHGTHNALVKTGDHHYLEIIAPDPENIVTAPLWMGLDDDRGLFRLTRWALKSTISAKNLDALQKYFDKDITVLQGERITALGNLLQWKMTFPYGKNTIETVPFLIHWGSEVHPVNNLIQQCSWIETQLISPNTVNINHTLMDLGSNAIAIHGKHHAIQAVFDSPKGRVTLS